ncbi:hypothetical protein TVAG_093580 [Trichomonas vaginalis G3]|uniref:Uncharacterized protein n=1 Tax=Trichomonas vaginalis (strain ATCC PRA-98 / G3) TaxID=412133 RepID=A2DBI1_TRIV3|nr:protein ubiquitination [Trichomonas vaginalis G3]EAY22184.1 hypothetical protein TVAG_093580 [Trichomonas vaginalis G3]KAI5533358.1 protein ubiquitination [Trichomonas vaginalis G3]|eukprot:XP_001583170.1 hypothetical protein [Trichomonas vaginalis G3]
MISVEDNIGEMDNNGYTPLIMASFGGHLEVVKYLITVEADREAKDNNDNTPLLKELENGQLKVVKFLIAVGADKEAKNNQGRTAWDVATSDVRKYMTSIRT